MSLFGTTVNSISLSFSVLIFSVEQPAKRHKILIHNMARIYFFITTPYMISLLFYTVGFENRRKKHVCFRTKMRIIYVDINTQIGYNRIETNQNGY